MSCTAARPSDRPAWYEIRLGGHLAHRWAARFDGMTLANRADGTTVLTGPVVDQSALHGLLLTVRDLGLPLLAVTRVEPTPPNSSQEMS